MLYSRLYHTTLNIPYYRTGLQSTEEPLRFNLLWRHREGELTALCCAILYFFSSNTTLYCTLILCLTFFLQDCTILFYARVTFDSLPYKKETSIHTTQEPLRSGPSMDAQRQGELLWSTVLCYILLSSIQRYAFLYCASLLYFSPVYYPKLHYTFQSRLLH